MKFSERLSEEAASCVIQVEALDYAGLKQRLTAELPALARHATWKLANVTLQEPSASQRRTQLSFASSLEGELLRLSRETNRAAETLWTELNDASTAESVDALMHKVEQLHTVTTLSYIGVIKLVRAWNKHSGQAQQPDAPGSAHRLQCLHFLLKAPVFTSSQLHLLFQRVAKLRLRRHSVPSLRPSCALAVAVPAACPAPQHTLSNDSGADSGACSTSSGGASFSSSPTSGASPTPAATVAAVSDAGGGVVQTRRPSQQSDFSGLRAGPAGGAAPTIFEPVRCNGCVRRLSRFVLLGCDHAFCWSCTALMMLRTQQKAARGPASKLRRITSMPEASTPSSPSAAWQRQAREDMRPPLSPPHRFRRLDEAEDEVSSATEDAAEPPSSDFVECCVCDSVSDLSAGHLEVNPLLGPHSYVWMLEGLRTSDSERRQHGTKRSLSVGIDFEALFSAVPGVIPSGSIATLGKGGSSSSATIVEEDAEGEQQPWRPLSTRSMSMPI